MTFSNSMQFISYSFTFGISNTKINTYPFIYPLPLPTLTFTLEMIQSSLIYDGIDFSLIDSFKYLNTNKGGYIEIKDDITYSMPNVLTLLLHVKEEASEKEISDLEGQISDIETQLDISHKTSPNSFNSFLIDSSSKVGFSRTTSMANEQQKDLLYLYACPIVKQLINSDSYSEFSEQIDYQNEIEKIVNSISQTKKIFNAHFEAADFDMLTNSIRKFPKILHISSHGITKEEKNTSYFYLCLEREGSLCEVREDRIRSILSQEERISTIDLVIISACHSEALGRIFFEAGIKNVICVQGMTKISDVAAQSFASHLYQYLINGETIKEAFNKSKLLFRNVAVQGELQECCCLHQHKQNCTFINLTQAERTEYHSIYHIKKCSCYFSEYHTHKIDCKSLKRRSKNSPIITIDYNNTIKHCCCSPEIAHNESNKFILMSEGDTIIFPSLMKGALSININCFLKCRLYKSKKIKIIGRNMEIKTLMHMLVKLKNRSIIIYGKKGTGKSSFVKYAAIYMFERKLFSDVYFIDIISLSLISEMIIAKIKEQIAYFDEKYLIILSFPNIQEEFLFQSIKEIINELLREFPLISFLILFNTSTDNIKFETEFGGKEFPKLKIEALASEWAELLLQNLVSNYSYKHLLSQSIISNLIKETEGYPSEIFLMAHSLQETKHIDQFKAINIERKKTLENQRIEIIKTVMNTEIANRLLFILSTLPKGISQSHLELMDSRYTNNINPKIIISFHKEKTNEYWYKLINSLIPQVNSISKDEIKQESIYQIVKMYSTIFIIELKKLKANYINSFTELNAVNDQGMWLSLNHDEYAKLFKDIGNLDVIQLKYLKKHRYNIEFLIENNKSLIKDLITKKNSSFIECLEQITICFPTIFKIKSRLKECNEIINQFTILCEEFKLIQAKYRLILFMLCNEKNNCNFDPEEQFRRFKEGKAEAYFLKGKIYLELKEPKQEIVSYLSQSYKLFSEVNSDYGQAKVSYILAKYYLDKLNKINKAKEHFQKAISHTIASTNNCLILINSYIELASIELANKNYINANDYAKKAKKESIENKLILYESQANYILDQISNKLNNVFTVVAANQLIDLNNEPLPFSSSNNAYIIQQAIVEKINKVIRFNQIVLNKENLLQALNLSGLILIIFSDDYNTKGDLFYESKEGQSVLVTKDELQKQLASINIKYKIVILAYINSSLGILDFSNRNIPHIISFDQMDPLLLNKPNALLAFNSLMVEFIIHFFVNALNTSTSIENAFIKAKNTFVNALLRVDEFFLYKNNNFISLFSLYSESNYYLCEKEEINDGKAVINRPLVKFPRITNARMFERNNDLFNLVQLVKKNQIVNLYGPSLSGKTLLAGELCKFFYRHNCFTDGIYFVDNKDKLQRLSDIVKSITKNDGDILIVIDKNDKVVRKTQKQQIKFQDKIPSKIHVLLVSREPIQEGQIILFQLNMTNNIVSKLTKVKAVLNKIGVLKKCSSDSKVSNAIAISNANSNVTFSKEDYIINGSGKKLIEKTPIKSANVKIIFSDKYSSYKYNLCNIEEYNDVIFPYIKMEDNDHSE